MVLICKGVTRISSASERLYGKHRYKSCSVGKSEGIRFFCLFILFIYLFFIHTFCLFFSHNRPLTYRGWKCEKQKNSEGKVKILHYDKSLVTGKVNFHSTSTLAVYNDFLALGQRLMCLMCRYHSDYD